MLGQGKSNYGRRIRCLRGSPLASTSNLVLTWKQPNSREYGRSQSCEAKSAWVCGALTSGLLSSGHSPLYLGHLFADSDHRVTETVNSSRSSDSVGSTISVPATGTTWLVRGAIVH